MKFLSACIVLLGLLICDLSAQNKAVFDIDDETTFQDAGQGNDALRKGTGATTDRAALGNAFTAATLLRGAYFTFGTTGGSSGSRLDDNCQLTYGHPYALTSFVEFFWDGVWRKADVFFSGDEQRIVPGQDSLRLELLKSGVCHLSVLIRHSAQDGTLSIEAQLRNLDTAPHQGALAIQLDPALGRWGDAGVFLAGIPVQRDTLLTAAELSAGLLLYERAQADASGLKAAVSWPMTAPDQLRIANWQPALGPVFNPADPRPRQLFDVVLRAEWRSATLQASDAVDAALALSLPQPDFPAGAFMRFDLPTALELDKGALFPREFPVMVETYNGDTAPFDNAKLRIVSASDILAPTTSLWGVAAAAKDFGYTRATFRSNEIYEEEVVPVTFYCDMGGATLDSVTRNVYIPAVALADTGLIIAVDTVDTGLLPVMTMYFGINDAWTNVPVTAVRKEHVWLWENGNRIRDFILEKDARSGVNAVDVVFALDVTGSMSGEIAAVRDNIHAFTNELTEKGISFRLGLVTFYDTIGDVLPLTPDVSVFQSWVAKQVASGGGDAPENSLEALRQATLMDFRPQAHRLIVWITDEDYHEGNVVTPLTVKQVLEMLLNKAITVHAIGAVHRKQRYDRITEPTGGLFFDINGNFRDILLDISRFNVSTLYQLRYVSPLPDTTARRVDIEVHFAGKGGAASWQSPSPPQVAAEGVLECYPNPFNPAVTLLLRNAAGSSGWLSVMDGNGREVERFAVDGLRDEYRFVWDVRDRGAAPRASGVYFIHTQLRREGGPWVRGTASVVYTK